MKTNTLELLPGLRWRGKLRVEGERDGGFLVQFDAEIVGAASGEARIVYDRTVLTAKQLKDWTGVSLTPSGGAQ